MPEESKTLNDLQQEIQQLRSDLDAARKEIESLKQDVLKLRQVNQLSQTGIRKVQFRHKRPGT